MSRGGAAVGIGRISRTILGYAEGLISKGLDIRKLVVRVVIGVGGTISPVAVEPTE